MHTLIVVSTMTGTAEMIAEDVAAALQATNVKMRLAENLASEEVRAAELVLVVSSTYGDGEVPEPAKRLFRELENGPRLDAQRFGVVGLGDHSLYAPTFAKGGQRWDEMLEGKGAARLAPLLTIDVASAADISAPAIEWARGALQQAEC